MKNIFLGYESINMIWKTILIVLFIIAYHELSHYYQETSQKWSRILLKQYFMQGVMFSTDLTWLKCKGKDYYTYLIICGTVTLEFSSNTIVIKPLHRILSTHCEIKKQTISTHMKT